jgi:beta-phosphoglucomutase-like phosphatase (HAD superfamily)
VYLETAARMGVDPPSCVAIEDSDAGIRSAQAAGMTVVALPNPGFPPSEEALGLASVRVESPAELTPALLEGSLTRRPANPR